MLASRSPSESFGVIVEGINHLVYDKVRGGQAEVAFYVRISESKGLFSTLLVQKPFRRG